MDSAGVTWWYVRWWSMQCEMLYWKAFILLTRELNQLLFFYACDQSENQYLLEVICNSASRPIGNPSYQSLGQGVTQTKTPYRLKLMMLFTEPISRLKEGARHHQSWLELWHRTVHYMFEIHTFFINTSQPPLLTITPTNLAAVFFI